MRKQRKQSEKVPGLYDPVHPRGKISRQNCPARRGGYEGQFCLLGQLHLLSKNCKGTSPAHTATTGGPEKETKGTQFQRYRYRSRACII